MSDRLAGHIQQAGAIAKQRAGEVAGNFPFNVINPGLKLLGLRFIAPLPVRETIGHWF